MQNKYVIDTMALILYLEERKLSKEIKSIFTAAENGDVQIIIPAMVVAELAYLAERNRIDTNINEVKRMLAGHNNFLIEPLNLEIIEAAFKINNIPELHDRLIAATAITVDVALISNDPIIHASGSLSVIW